MQRNPTVQPANKIQTRIIGAVARGYTAKQITRALNLPRTKVQDTLAKFNLTAKLLRHPLRVKPETSTTQRKTQWPK